MVRARFRKIRILTSHSQEGFRSNTWHLNKKILSPCPRLDRIDFFLELSLLTSKSNLKARLLNE